ncbi:MAG: helix-turn-helix transcriptional regulator [Humidesulfovibrio sp.]
MGNPDDMVLMEVSGNSMAPELLDGDTVLINQGQTDILSGKIYAVGIEDTAVAKRVERRPGALVLRSSNPAYPELEVDMRGGCDTVRIIGRIIWWCHEER